MACLLVLVIVLQLLHAAHAAPAPPAPPGRPRADSGALPPMPACGAPSTLTGPLPLAGGFDYWLLRLFWAPALYATDVDGSAVAQQKAAEGAVASGWWVHGLWDSSTAGRAAPPPGPGGAACAGGALGAGNLSAPLLRRLARLQPGVPGNFSLASGGRRAGPRRPRGRAL
jgi:ribonuclease I